MEYEIVYELKAEVDERSVIAVGRRRPRSEIIHTHRVESCAGEKGARANFRRWRRRFSYGGKITILECNPVAFHSRSERAKYVRKLLQKHCFHQQRGTNMMEKICQFMDCEITKEENHG